MKIVLCCAGGYSTTMLMNAMKGAVEKSPKLDVDDFEFKAISVDVLDAEVPTLDAVVLGPQIAHKLSTVEKALDGKKVPIVVVDSTTYGKMDGALVMKKVLVEQIKIKRAQEGK